MFAIPVAKLLNINELVLVIVSGAVMTATAYYGFKALAIVL